MYLNYVLLCNQEKIKIKYRRGGHENSNPDACMKCFVLQLLCFDQLVDPLTIHFYEFTH